MGLISWLADKMGIVPLSGQAVYEAIEEYATEVHVRELAFWNCANMVGNSISNCEFRTFRKGKEVKEKEYYLWNVEPNKNQNASEFHSKLISQLYRNNECLVIQENDQLFVADSFNQKEFALRENLFENVTVNDFSFNKTYNMGEVLYFKQSEKDMNSVIRGLYDSYSKLIAYSMKAYQKSRGTKGIFKYDTIPVAGTEARTAFDSLINEKISKWLNSDNAALPLGNGQDWKELTSKTYSNEATRDIRAQIDDISDFTAKAFNIPPALIRGNIEGVKDARTDYLTFCIDPLATKIAQEANRKRNGYKAYSEGTYMQIDTKQIMHIDLLNAAPSIDRLLSSGAFCINDVLKMVGEPTVNEEWAKKHFRTKRQADVNDIESLEGGE